MKSSIYVGIIFAWLILSLVSHAGPIIDQNNINGSFETGEISPWMGGTVKTNFVLMTYGDGAVYTEPWPCEPDALRTYTIAAWIRPSSTSSHSDRVILERAVRVPGFTPGSWDIRWNFRLGLDSQGRPFVRHDADGSQRLTASVSGPPVNSNQWTHLAAKYDSEYLSLYQNASLVGFMPTAIVPLNGWFYGNPPVQKPSAITIGAGNTTVLGSPPELTEYICGELDEISIWDGPLLNDDIESLMYTKALGTESNLIGYWGFDDETARDISTNSIDGVFVNSTSAEQRIVFPATLNIEASSSAGNCVLRFRSIQDARYAVETNYSLINGPWMPMVTNVTGSGFDIAVTNALGTGATFYRVLSLE